MSSKIPENFSAATRRDSLSPILLVFVLLASAVILYCIARELHSPWLHRDSASYVYEANEVLAGVQLYGPQMIETNPPLIVWLSILPVSLSHLLHISIILALKLFLFALLGIITFWCYSLLQRAGSRLSPAQRLLMALGIPLTVLLTQADAFAQREQFVVLFLLPYIVAAATEVSASASERILLGVFAGLAISLKPFHLCALIGVELLLILWKRSFRSLLRVELITLLVTGAAFLAAVRIFAPPYLTDAMPVLHDTFWGFSEHTIPGMIVTTAVPIELLALCGWGAWALLRRKLNLPLVSAALFAAGTGAIVAFVLQETTWPYHEYPACVFLYLAIAWLAIDALTAFAQPFLRQTWRTPALWAMTAAAALITCGVVIKYQRYIRRHEAPMSVGLLFATYPPGTSVYELSPGMGVYDELLEYHLHWGGRYVCLWTLPAIVRNEYGPVDPTLPFKKLSPETVASLAARLRRDTAEDLATQRPKVVAVSQCSPESHCQGLDRPLDIVKWFSVDPQFAAEWSHYQRQESIPDFDVYVRTP